jgi:hypothetical protein
MPAVNHLKAKNKFWRAVWDDFRNWLGLGLQPAKGHENQGAGQNGTGGSGEIESSQWSRRGRATV